jgi:hypothetical protein
MKTIVISIILITLGYRSYSQNVNIPDIHFKNALIEAGVDTDDDGEISYDEAEVVDSLDVSGGWGVGARCSHFPYGEILSLEGIESFKNLLTLNCSGNQLSSLDMSNNTSLKELDCSVNYLTNLDVTGCIALEVLNCIHNPLTTLDLSNCTSLTELHVFCNFSLEICVWEMPLPESVYVDIPDPSFTTQCLTTILNDYKENERIDIYPNPASNILNVDMVRMSRHGLKIEIISVTGEVIYSEKLSTFTSSNHTVDLSAFAEGIYLIRVSNDDYSVTEKIVKVE